ncbi:regulatory protein RecX [Allosphingosinicella vermicomposti]|uniref:regulatory protein RecX n=1 Tax=Allosphingosinicella vermicomposti TaxID=614671 RepID=UPI001FDF5F4A|nr:RecX family transcriptional regulator [Allosphingosinicella vermicomposti]
MKHQRHRKARPPLGEEELKALALAYVGRYATSRAKLSDYLRRKVKERGWADDQPPAIAALTERFTELGYIDDRAFASARAASLGRRGYGERRVAEALRAAGIGEEDSTDARDIAAEGARGAALRFARRRRIGPYAAAALDGPAQQKAFAAMLRAGHSIDITREILNSAPGDVPEEDSF